MLPKIEHDMLQEAGRQELVTVQQICGAVLENYPDVEQDFILGLRQPTNSLQEKGEQILKQYGYDEEHLLADNTLYRIVAEIMDQHRIYSRDKEARLFEGQGNRPPVHTGMFHYDPNISS